MSRRLSTRQEQAGVVARMRDGGRTWVQIAEVLRRDYGLTARAALRRAHGWSQQDAADRWSALWPDDVKDAKTFSYWERWPRSGSGHAPTFANLVKLARLYQCSVADCLADIADYRHLDVADGGDADRTQRSATRAGHRSVTGPELAATAARPVDERDTVGRAVDRTFVRMAPAAGTGEVAESPVRTLEHRVRAVWANGGRDTGDRPLLTLVGGFAGSGKTEFGRFLSHLTGWTLLDKDALTRPLVERLLTALGGDPNDRHTALYVDQVRALEYRCLLDAAFENLARGVSTVLTAPFLTEMTDEGWSSRLLNRCAGLGVDVAVVWLHCDEDTMHDYIRRRGAGRDTWKLETWEHYIGSIDVSARPFVDHFVVDNRFNAATSLADQAGDLLTKVRR